MNFFLVAAFIISPALFWILYFRYKDRYQPEPFLDMGGAFLLGFLSGFLCFGYMKLFQPMGIPHDLSGIVFREDAVSLVYLIFIVGFLEELFKLIMFVFIIKWFKNFDETIDGIIYASIIGLGFAAYENLLYLPYLSGWELFGRAVASPLTHTIFASLWGFHTGKVFLTASAKYHFILMVFGLSFILHGIYDFFSLSTSLRLISSLLILAVWIWRIILIEKQHRFIHSSINC